MWRFLVISFAVLALTFYELSGGAGYEPAPNSIQARADLVRPKARPETGPPAPGAQTLAEVEALMDQLNEAETKTEQVSVTLATARTDGIGILAGEASRPKAELLELEDVSPKPETDASIESAIAAAIGEARFEDEQLRWVKEGMVDLRTGPGLSFDTVTRLTKGTEVAVVEDPGHGWLKVQLVDGYQSGWLAEWLVTRPR